ncbi:hypothetical protein [Croceicoccus pelagius]|uniref:Antitoxin Xre/MbcA/ParS-like toxin-binding domain-containing protein n=1 Tax=Croceicoccus pelagius TaxID=1703341 RepID=A0A917DL76_9SPHN|nr:hypothetical protein [Croceicoccus pelagius]GGD48041.1 hypothetical protein GCM10010989_22980 [Croceicoccus pelagius]
MTKNEIIAILEPRFASKAEACEWYTHFPIPGFNGKTTDQLVKDGLGSAVISFIESVDAGVHA